tara:strand:+ start:432 stop:1076 length:645 start_codon:yes stop_codon:yes gene_type:complete
MEELTDKQIRIRWGEVKKVIKDRPLLAYKVGIPLEQWDKYMHSVPSRQEVNRIHEEIRDDRTQKTKRIREELLKIVGYRESKEYSRKSNVSDTIIRGIIEGKKLMVGYDVINRLELFLSRINNEFEVSIENPLDLKTFTEEKLGIAASQITKTSYHLKDFSIHLIQYSKTLKKQKDFKGDEVNITESLKYIIQHLNDIQDDIESFCKTYVEGKK